VTDDVLAGLTWICHVCADERPDAVIAVAHGSALIADGRTEAGVNVRYCCDRVACGVGAQELVDKQVALLQEAARS
jgi:hypothetical protein